MYLTFRLGGVHIVHIILVGSSPTNLAVESSDSSEIGRK